MDLCVTATLLLDAFRNRRSVSPLLVRGASFAQENRRRRHHDRQSEIPDFHLRLLASRAMRRLPYGAHQPPQVKSIILLKSKN
jgi:hypothetical protein